MCRWAAYLGPEVFLEDVVTAPCHSLIAQSHHALEANGITTRALRRSNGGWR